MDFFSDTSDYGSASSMSGSPWQSAEWSAWSLGAEGAGAGAGAAAAAGAARGGAERTRTLSFGDAAALSEAVSAREVAMREFRLNGSDAPFDPEPRALLRQRSWPAPCPPPRAAPPRAAPRADWGGSGWTDACPAGAGAGAAGAGAGPTPAQQQALAALRALPPDALTLLVREVQRRRPHRGQYEGCRFCKNNGERESVYRAHALRDAAGRVACPVLRAYVCKRCGARDDDAHTIKYCPFSSEEERRQSDGMMRSVRMASGRRRAPSRGRHEYYYDGSVTTSGGLQQNYFDDPVAPLRYRQDNYFDGLTAPYDDAAPLDPVWAALEEKLSSMT